MSESQPLKIIRLSPIQYVRGRFVHAHKGRGRRRGHSKPYELPSKTKRRLQRELNDLHEMLTLTMEIELETSQHMHRLGNQAYGAYLFAD